MIFSIAVGFFFLLFGGVLIAVSAKVSVDYAIVGCGWIFLLGVVLLDSSEVL